MSPKKVTIKLDESIFGIQPNVPVMHQVVTAQLAARRAGTQSTKTRAEVRGGGAKPWRQKGTGRARQGSNRAPHWVGGGVTHAPKPRSYEQRTPKKMVRLALHSALSDRAADDKVLVVDSWGFETPKTKDAVKALDSLGVEGKTLVVLGESDDATWLSFRNVPNVHCLLARELNAYDVLVADYIVFTRETVPGAGKADAVVADDDTPVVVEKAKAKAAAKGKAQAKADAPYGPGSAAPLEDGSAPDGFEIKGNADSMLYHEPGSRYYKATKAEAWFATVEDAERAGFSAPASSEGDEDE